MAGPALLPLRHFTSPATSCGGTTLQLTSGAISSETVWNDASGAGGGATARLPSAACAWVSV